MKDLGGIDEHVCHRIDFIPTAAKGGNCRRLTRLPRPNEIAAAAAAINNELPKMLLPSIMNHTKNIILLVLLQLIMNYQKH